MAFATSNNMNYLNKAQYYQSSTGDSPIMVLAQQLLQQQSSPSWRCPAQQGGGQQLMNSSWQTQRSSGNWFNPGSQIQSVGKGRSDLLLTPGGSSGFYGEPTSVLDVPLRSPQSPPVEQKRHNLGDNLLERVSPSANYSILRCGSGKENYGFLSKGADSCLTMGTPSITSELYRSSSLSLRGDSGLPSEAKRLRGLEEAINMNEFKVQNYPAFKIETIPTSGFPTSSVSDRFDFSSSPEGISNVFSATKVDFAVNQERPLFPAADMSPIEWMDNFLELPTPTSTVPASVTAPLNLPSFDGQFDSQLSPPVQDSFCADNGWPRDYSVTPDNNQVSWGSWSTQNASNTLLSPTGSVVSSSRKRRADPLLQERYRSPDDNTLSLPSVQSLANRSLGCGPSRLPHENQLFQKGGIGGTTFLSGNNAAPVPPAWEPQRVGDGHELGVQLVHLLLECAEAMDSGKDSSHATLSQLQKLSSPYGDPMQRVAAHFSDALSRRLTRLEARPYRSVSDPAQFADSPCNDPDQGKHHEDSLVAFRALNDATPYTKFAHFTSNQVILEAGRGSEQLHIIDFGIMHGVQWAALLQALAPMQSRPRVRLTGIASPELGLNSMTSLLATGKRLSEFATAHGVEFEFCPVSTSLQDIEPSVLEIQDRECVVVNFMLQLHHLLADSSEPLQRLLRGVRRMKPAVITLAECEANLNRASFQPRFLEALHYYSAIFDSLDATMPRESIERFKSESLFFGPEIQRIVGFEGAARKERLESYANWRTIMESCGFKSTSLSSYTISQARLLLWRFCDSFRLTEKPGCLTLGWLDHPLITVSAWQCC